MKKCLSPVILSLLILPITAQAQTNPSAENMDDFHPEITAGQVPAPEVDATQENAENLAVVPFEEGTATASKEKIEEIEIYPTGQRPIYKSSEPDNPVNNVLKSDQKIGAVMQAPTLKISPPKHLPENLFGQS